MRAKVRTGSLMAQTCKPQKLNSQSEQLNDIETEIPAAAVRRSSLCTNLQTIANADKRSAINLNSNSLNPNPALSYVLDPGAEEKRLACTPKNRKG